MARFTFILMLAAAAFQLFGCQTANEQLAAVPVADQKPVLMADDIVEVIVFGEEDLSGVHEVSTDGTIHLPLIRDVPVAGLTPLEARQKIEDLYNQKYLKRAQVELAVKEYNSRKIYVLGQVSKPGPYDYEANMTVIGALSLAGGPTRLADLNRTRVTREGRDQEKQSMVVEANDIQKGTAPDVEIAPGDIIFIPETLF